MNRAIQQFETNIESANQLGLIFQAFSEKVTEAICLDELLRAEIVLAVSALDCYIHDLVRIVMTQAFNSSSSKSNAYLNFGVSIDCMEKILRSSDVADRLPLFDQEIRRLHGFKTFQTDTNISQALSIIGISAVWDKVGGILGESAKDVRTKLNIIIDRRNRIAHEGDIDPALGIGAKYPIDFTTVKQTVDFIESIVHSIQQVTVREALSK